MSEARRRWYRVGSWAFGAAALAAALLMAVSFVTTRSVVASRHGVVLYRGKVEFAAFSAPFTRSGAVWVSPAGPRILVGPESDWRPSRARAGIVMSGPTGAPVATSLSVVYVPLAFVLGVTALPAAGLWMMGRRKLPVGACRGCGYDLRGTVGGRCPECGREESLARRVIRRVERALLRQGTRVPAGVAGVS